MSKEEDCKQIQDKLKKGQILRKLKKIVFLGKYKSLDYVQDALKKILEEGEEK